MDMKIKRSYLRIATSMALLLAGLGCQTAKKPVSALPAFQASPPPIQASAPARTSPAPTTAKPTAPVRSVIQQAEPKPDPVVEVIGKAETEYQAGLDQYNAGQKDQAKVHFDRAFNLLMASPSDVRSDLRFQHEFDRVLESINKLESSAVQQSETAPEQKSEPAPIDEANEVTNYPVDPSLKAQATAEIKATHSDLPLMMTDQVAGYINYFSSRGHGTLERALTRSGRYREMIERILKEEGVPQDLIYLAQAESGFHPYAVSRAGARGIWQFMGNRARAYDLHHDSWVDDRQDPEKSTRAAAHHLKDLYNQFGDWYLAMAAYNSGPGTVQAAVRRTGYADFWELYQRNVLPKETRNYVPIILAVTIIAKNPSQYGLQDIAMDHPAKYDSVTITYPVDLRLVAECVGATTVELQELNPSLLRLTTPREGKYELHLPAGTKDEYQSAIATIPTGMRLWWRYHTVQTGDTLASLSKTYRAPAKSIAEVNHLDGTDLEAGAKLVIPVAPGKHPMSDTATYARRITRYRVHKGDSVETVAENFGVSPQMLRRWNGLRGDSLRGRRVLALHLPISPGPREAEVVSSRSSKSSRHGAKTQPAQSNKRTASVAKTNNEPANTDEASVIRHKVKYGETLYSIATSYKTTVAALKRDNSNVAVLR